jgi:hypothetical protein
MANASFVLGCISLGSILLADYDLESFKGLSSFLFFLGLFACIPAIICAHCSRSAIGQSGGKLIGKNRAFVGLVTGYLVFLGFCGGALFPASHARTQARRAQAKSDVMQITRAIEQYHTEYGKYPVEGDQTVGHDEKVHNSAIFDALRVLSAGPNSDSHLNQRKIVFFEGRNVPDPSHPRGGFADTDEMGPGLKGSYFDPWGHEYLIRIHYDATKPFVAPDGTMVNGNVIVWSPGPDGVQGTADDIVSWK